MGIRNTWQDKGREGRREGEKKKSHHEKITMERTFDYLDPYV